MREAALTGMTRAEVSRHLAAELLYAPDAKLRDFQFIDAGGRRWRIDKYFKMLGRTMLFHFCHAHLTAVFQGNLHKKT